MTTSLSLDPMQIYTREIAPFHPEPADPFEHALWCSEMATVFEKLSIYFEDQYSQDINRIQTEHLTSDIYALHTPVSLHRVANVDKLRRELPEIYARIVFIRPYDAEKILGRRRLHELAQQAAGDRILPLELINISDLRRELTGEELPAYLKVLEKPHAPVIIRQDEPA